MEKVRVTKKFGFEMAHALWNYDGLCKNIHGHSYKLDVTVIGYPKEERDNSKQGMVLDFGVLKTIVKETVIDKYDHSIIINENAPVNQLQHIEQMYDRYHIMKNQPTCENLVIEFAHVIKNQLPDDVELLSIKLSETDTSYAEWNARDQH
jgi:6-pyruvoyltetrahydropterin/6-carboxytetrahydropterin synthase